MNTLKKMAAILAVMAVAMTAFTACGSTGSQTESVAESVAEETTEAASEEETTEAETEEETDTETEEETAADAEGFTLLDVDASMIETGLYAKDENDTEYVLSLFTYNETPYCSMIIVAADGTSDVVCGAYTGATNTDENGVDWTVLDFDDVYTGNAIEIGFAEPDGECYILDQAGNTYEAQYLDADQTVTYMGAAVAVAADAESDAEAETAADAEGFTLLDVDASMIETGLYAKDEDGVEYVLSLFTYNETPYCSMIIVAADGSSDVVCGAYTGATSTDENGVDWTVLDFDDVYTGSAVEIGFAEPDGECYILDQAGNAYEAQYLDADQTVTYMGAAVAVAADAESDAEAETAADAE